MARATKESVPTVVEMSAVPPDIVTPRHVLASSRLFAYERLRAWRRVGIARRP